MSFLVDTDVVSAHLRGHRGATTKLLHYLGRLHASVVTLAELKTWLYRSSTPVRFRESFDALANDLVTLPVDAEVAEACGRLGADLDDKGRTLAIPDLLIASTALVHDLTLATGNERHFAPIAGLRVENWLQS